MGAMGDLTVAAFLNLYMLLHEQKCNIIHVARRIDVDPG